MAGMDSIGSSAWFFSRFRTAQGLTPSRPAAGEAGDVVRARVAASEAVAATLVAEAIQYRKLDRAV